MVRGAVWEVIRSDGEELCAIGWGWTAWWGGGPAGFGGWTGRSFGFRVNGLVVEAW